MDKGNCNKLEGDRKSGTERNRWGERVRKEVDRRMVGRRMGLSEYVLCSEDASSVVQFNLLDQNKHCTL